LSLQFSTSLPAVDHYMTNGFDAVRGMSSRFATTICACLLARQTELGIGGHFAEIGTFEGRFFIAMALALSGDEKALGIDTFDWPSAALLGRFTAHCERFGIADARLVVHRGRSEELSPGDVGSLLGGPVRMWHVDGEHSRTALQRDLDLACSTLHPDGLIVVDDMLHPEYPLLVVALHEWLERHRDMRVVCVIDREDIVAASKFVLCRTQSVGLYEDDLMSRFKRFHYVMGSEWERYFCVVLTPEPRLAPVD
jgi:predicted O-methyltransferase YrrM